MRKALPLLALLVAGCATTGPSPLIPTPTPHVPSLPTEPVTGDTSSLAPTRVQPSTSHGAPSDEAPTASLAASTAGDLTEAVFVPSIGRWKAVPGEGDENTYQSNGTWVHALDPAETAINLGMQTCSPAPPLPRPRSVLASDYKDASGARGVGQALRFDSVGKASAFVRAYTATVKTCVDRQNPFRTTLVAGTSPPLVDRRVALADDSRWIEFVRQNDSLVKLLILNGASGALSTDEIKAAASRF